MILYSSTINASFICQRRDFIAIDKSPNRHFFSALVDLILQPAFELGDVLVWVLRSGLGQLMGIRRIGEIGALRLSRLSVTCSWNDGRGARQQYEESGLGRGEHLGTYIQAS